AGVKIFSDIRVQRASHKNDYWEITVLCNGVVSHLHSRILVLATGLRTDLMGRVCKERPSNIVLTTRTPTTGIWQNGTLYLEATQNGWWYLVPYSPADQLVGYYTKINLIKQSKLPLRDIFFRELRGTRLVGSLGRYPLDHETITGQLAGVQTYDRIQGDS